MVVKYEQSPRGVAETVVTPRRRDARRRDALETMRRDWWKFYRVAFFVRFSAWRALTLAFAVVSLCSEQWLEPKRPARALPGISRAGLWRVCYHFSNIDARRPDRSSITRWWREMETSFRGLGRDSRQCSTEIGEFYGDVFGGNHMSLVELTRACAVGFIFYGAMELVCEVFYFIRRRRAKAGFASTSAAVYGGFAEIACIIACVSYAVLVARVRADMPSYIAKDAFVDYLGWGYWMWLTCACAHSLSWTFVIVDWDSASKARAARRSHRAFRAQEEEALAASVP